MLTRVWLNFQFRIDVCRVTCGAHIEHLQLSNKKNFFSFPVAVNNCYCYKCLYIYIYTHTLIYIYIYIERFIMRFTHTHTHTHTHSGSHKTCRCRQYKIILLTMKTEIQKERKKAKQRNKYEETDAINTNLSHCYCWNSECCTEICQIWKCKFPKFKPEGDCEASKMRRQAVAHCGLLHHVKNKSGNVRRT
jgi:hypothetical protein